MPSVSFDPSRELELLCFIFFITEINFKIQCPKAILHDETIPSEIRVLYSQKAVKNFLKELPGGGGGTPLFGLYGHVPLDRVWFFGLAVLNRVYNLTCLCPKQVKNLS